jgi:hypothetical protein
MTTAGAKQTQEQRQLAQQSREYLARKTEREKARLFRQPARAGGKRHPGRRLRAINCWEKWEDELLGTVLDQELARRLGRTFIAVRARRISKRIPPVIDPKTEALRWKPHEPALLGTLPDRETTKRLGRSYSAVLSMRLKLRLPCVTVLRPWTKAELALLGKFPDKEIARRTKRNYRMVHAKRKQLGISNSAGLVRDWSKAEDKLLGTAPDVEIARRWAAARTACRSVAPGWALRPAIPTTVRGRRRRIGGWVVMRMRKSPGGSSGRNRPCNIAG